MGSVTLAVQFHPVMVFVAVQALIVLLFLFIVLRYGILWMRALMSGAPIPLVRLVGMALRRVPPRLIADMYIKLRSGGVDVGVDQLEAHHLAGGSVLRVADWLIAAEGAGANINADRLFAKDLAGDLPDVGLLSDYDRRQVLAGLRDETA